MERFVAKHLKTKLKNGFLYLTKDGVYFNQRNLGPLAEYFFFVHAGARIGTIKKNTFTPTHHLFWCIEDTSSIPSLEMTPSLWSEVLAKRTATVSYGDGYYAVSYCGRDVGIGEVKK